MISHNIYITNYGYLHRHRIRNYNGRIHHVQHGACMCDTVFFSLVEGVEIPIIILWATSLFHTSWEMPI